MREFDLVQMADYKTISSFFSSFHGLQFLSGRFFTALTYSAQQWIGLITPFHYHAINIALHLLNVALLFGVARRSGVNPIWACLFFALHPLTSAITGQVYSRSYALGTTFILLSLRLEKFNWKAHIPLTILACACKQVFFYLPLLVISRDENMNLRSFYRKQKAVLALVGVLAAAIFFYFFYAKHFMDRFWISPATYFISEIANLHHLVAFYVFPFQTCFYHDLVFFHSPLAWPFFLNFSAMLSVIALYVRGVKSGRVPENIQWIFFCFFLTVIPTQSFIPKNEVIREWRLYPSLPFFAMLVSFAIEWLFERAPKLVFVPIIWLFLFSLTVRNQLEVYSTTYGMWHQVRERYTLFAEAYHNEAVELIVEKQDYRNALPLIEGARAFTDLFYFKRSYARILRLLAGLRNRGKSSTFWRKTWGNSPLPQQDFHTRFYN